MEKAYTVCPDIRHVYQILHPHDSQMKEKKVIVSVSSKNNWIFYGKGLQLNYIARPVQIRWLLWIGKFISYITITLEENEEIRDEKKHTKLRDGTI